MQRFALLAALIAAPAAHAYDYMDTCGGQPTRWLNGNTTFQLSTSRVSNELSFSTFRSLVDASFDEWSAPGCSAYNPTRGTDVALDPGGSSSANIVGVYESGWPGEWGSSTIGITLVSYNPSNCTIGDADMVFNAQNFIFNPGSNSPNRVDFRSVATHEAGHWAGIDHSNHSGSSLWPSYSGGTAERDLTCDDTEAICRNTPSGQITCTNDNYCSCGVSCESGTCSGDTPIDPGTGACTGAGATYSENEPNDWTGDSDVDYFQPTGGGDIVINGQVDCGNDGQRYTADADWFVIDLPCTDDARFSLDWTASADLDFVVFDQSDDPLAIHTDSGNSGPVTDDAVAGGRLFARVNCWEGTATNYTFTIDRPPFATGGTTNPTDDCNGLGWEGECQGDYAVWCDDGNLRESDCSNDGGCGLTENNGYWCLGEDGVRDTDDSTLVDTGDSLPLIPGCTCNSATTSPWTLLGGLPLLLLLPVLRRRS